MESKNIIWEETCRRSAVAKIPVGGASVGPFLENTAPNLIKEFFFNKKP